MRPGGYLAVTRWLKLPPRDSLRLFATAVSALERRGSGDGLKLDDYNLETVENCVIQAALEKHGGNVSRAARELGITRASLYRRMQKYGL